MAPDVQKIIDAMMARAGGLIPDWRVKLRQIIIKKEKKDE